MTYKSARTVHFYSLPLSQFARFLRFLAFFKNVTTFCPWLTFDFETRQGENELVMRCSRMSYEALNARYLAIYNRDRHGGEALFPI
jgi:hypothetical protein